MVFVNPSADAAPLAQAMAGLDLGLDPFLSGPLREVARVEYEAACNWKLLVENHIDVYHLWYLHARSLAAYEHRSFAWESLGDNWWSLEPLKDPSQSRFVVRLGTRPHAASHRGLPLLPQPDAGHHGRLFRDL